MKDNGEGTIEQDRDKGRNAGKAAEIAIPTGGTVGSIGGLAGGHPIAGGWLALALGLPRSGLASLFTRGADVNIESGTQVEMVCSGRLLLEEENLGGVGPPGSAPALVPVCQPTKTDGKAEPCAYLCPPGGLGCE